MKSLGRASQASNATVSPRVKCSVKSAFGHLYYLALRTMHRESLATICRVDTLSNGTVTLVSCDPKTKEGLRR